MKIKELARRAMLMTAVSPDELSRRLLRRGWSIQDAAYAGRFYSSLIDWPLYAPGDQEKRLRDILASLAEE